MARPRSDKQLNNAEFNYLIVSPCETCMHRFEGLQIFSCRAFPDGIPLPILAGNVDHRYPATGDNGIQYKPINYNPDNPSQT